MVDTYYHNYAMSTTVPYKDLWGFGYIIKGILEGLSSV